MDKFLETIKKIWENNFVKAGAYLVLAIVVALIASFVVKKLFKLIGLDKKLSGWGVRGGQEKGASKFIGKLTFIIVFLLFFPAVLNALGLEGTTEPIMNFVDTFISYIPNIIAAAVLIFVGIFIGQILSEVIAVLLSKTKIDELKKRLGKNRQNSTEMEENNENTPKISSIIGKIVYAIVVLIAIAEALTVLNIETISKPALKIISTVFEAIPDVFLAALIIILGVFLANIVASLLENILAGFNLDGILKKNMPEMKSGISISKIITGAVRAIIIIFVLAQGIDILGLSVFDDVMSFVISYIPSIIKAVAILVLAVLIANLAEGALKKSMGEGFSKIVRAVIYVVAGFMILSQLDFASTIVNFAFIITLSALAIAFAIAFGIGGKDCAKNLLNSMKTKKSNSSEDEEKNDNK